MPVLSEVFLRNPDRHYSTGCAVFYAAIIMNQFKRGSRHAAHAAKALRWRVKQLLKHLIKKSILSSYIEFDV